MNEWNGQFRLPENERSKGDFSEIVKSLSKGREEWLANEMSRRMPPDLFLRAYGNDKCKQDVARWLETNGFEIRMHPDREELCRGDEVLSVYPDPVRNPKFIQGTYDGNPPW